MILFLGNLPLYTVYGKCVKFFLYIAGKLSYLAVCFAGGNYLGYEYEVQLCERLVTGLLILATLLSVVFLFYYQNFASGLAL